MIRDRLASYLPLGAGEPCTFPTESPCISVPRMPCSIGLSNKRILAFPTGTRRLRISWLTCAIGPVERRKQIRTKTAMCP